MELDLEGEHASRAYAILSALVTPRPIAWVTTLDTAGVVNAAPFSFFNVLGANPPIRNPIFKKIFLLPLEEAESTFNLLRMLKDEKVISEREFFVRSRQIVNKRFFKEKKGKNDRRLQFQS
jgi:hypothetical protein